MATTAPTLEALLDFEAEWDRIIVLVLRGLPFPVHPLHDDAELKAPCLNAEFQFSGEAPASTGATLPQQRAVAGRLFDATSFAGAFTIETLVNRKWLNGENAVENRATLSRVRGGIRRLFMPSTQAFTPFLRWYSLQTVDVGVTMREIDETRDLDRTVFAFGINFAILTTAWPLGQ